MGRKAGLGTQEGTKAPRFPDPRRWSPELLCQGETCHLPPGPAGGVRPCGNTVGTKGDGGPGSSPPPKPGMGFLKATGAGTGCWARIQTAKWYVLYGPPLSRGLAGAPRPSVTMSNTIKITAPSGVRGSVPIRPSLPPPAFPHQAAPLILQRESPAPRLSHGRRSHGGVGGE